MAADRYDLELQSVGRHLFFVGLFFCTIHWILN
jgi:hypothetical protein